MKQRSTSHSVVDRADSAERVSTPEPVSEAVVAEDSQRRCSAVAKLAGALTGMYPPGYLEQLRAEWPD